MKTDKKKDNIFEIEFYEGIVKHSPDFVEALAALGDLYTKTGRYEDGLTIDRRLTQLRPKDSMVLYNLACSYSLLNDVSKALAAIKCALTLGYEDLEYLQKDDDLRNLRLDKEFQEYFTVVWQKELKKRATLPKTKKIFRDQ